MRSTMLFYIVLLLSLLIEINGISSPIPTYTNYTYSTEIQSNQIDLWWTIDRGQKEVLFELHMKTTGWIALGISPAGGMKGADIGLGWIDQTGQLHFEDRIAFGKSEPVVDNTTSDWIGLKGREQNGWTAIQFKRSLDTCDPMDFPIKSGTNILIFAYGVEDPTMADGKATITYHGDRRFTRMIPLQSYGNPSRESKFDGLSYFDFQLKNYAVPSSETTYHCKIHKIPSEISQRRHAIAHKTLVDPANRDLVHHLLMYECDASAVFDDNNLPDGLCDDIEEKIRHCSANIASGWAVGGDEIVEFPQVAGYPVGGDFEIKYYLVQMHYDNPNRMTNRTDNSGIRFYIGNELRPQEMGYLTFGTISSFNGITIPPLMDRFIIDAYCPSNGTKRLPSSGVTVFSAFPHTHLQGRSLWAKIIRNNKAIDYLFNAESYDFNYQFENRLAEPVKLYPGDEIASRCIYNTMNKNETTLGGEATKNEMCLHMFSYYPRVNNLYSCLNGIPFDVFLKKINASGEVRNESMIYSWLLQRKWTKDSAKEWQEFYNEAPRVMFAGHTADFIIEKVPQIPRYTDLKDETCKSNGERLYPFVSLLFVFFVFSSKSRISIY